MRKKDIIKYGLPTAWSLFKLALRPTPTHRQILRGKMRRFWLVYFRRRYVEEVLLPKRKAGCHRTGACCQLGLGCPAYDNTNRLCKIHPHKPLVCKLFPITNEDLKDRDLIYPRKSCGYYFEEGISSRFSSGEVDKLGALSS